MKKTIIGMILFLMICDDVFSQTGKKLNEIEKQNFERQMADLSKEIKTLQCDFVQEKTSSLVSEKNVAKGILLYKSPSALRWEYTKPSSSSLILNDNNAILLDKDGNKIGNDKVVKQLGNIIISMINGDGIKNNRQFSTEIYDNSKYYIIILTPIQKRLKEFYKNFELQIEKKSLLATEILMNEKSGDKTSILLNNRILNKNIDAKNFSF